MLDYKERLVPNSDKYMILLHGYGSDMNDLFALKGFFPEHNIISVQAPYDLDFGGKAWFNIHFDSSGVKDYALDEYEESLNTLESFIEKLIQKHNIARDQAYIMGFSQGAAMAMAYALENHDKVKHVISTSGVITDRLLDFNVYKQVHDFDLKVYQSHGVNDPVVSFEIASKGLQHLQELSGVDVSFYEYPMGHTISQENLQSLMDWVKEN